MPFRKVSHVNSDDPSPFLGHFRTHFWVRFLGSFWALFRKVSLVIFISRKETEYQSCIFIAIFGVFLGFFRLFRKVSHVKLANAPGFT